jgi:hypothetical protein
MFNRYLKVFPSKTGNGVFTTVDIPANTPILEFGGNIYHRSELGDLKYDQVLQIDLDQFMGPSGGVDDFVNHSCSPNCLLHIIGNRAILQSVHLIKADSELTFDYSTSSTDSLDNWQMTCQCGEFSCRKIISGFQHLDENNKMLLQNKGMVPLFITNKIMKNAFRSK